MVFDHFNRRVTWFFSKNRSATVKCLEGSNSEIACGARLESLKKPKNAVRKIALKVIALVKPVQDWINWDRALTSMIFFVETVSGLLILRDFMKYLTCGWSKIWNCKL